MTHNRIVCFRECHLLLENDEKLLRNFILTQRGSKGENQLYVELCVGLKRLQKNYRNQKKRPLKIFIKKETKHHKRGTNSRTYETKQRSKASIETIYFHSCKRGSIAKFGNIFLLVKFQCFVYFQANSTAFNLLKYY